MKQYKKPRKSQTLFSLDFVEMIPSPQLGFLRGFFLANHLASNDNLIRTTKGWNTYQQKLTIHEKGALINNRIRNLLRYKTDRTWFSRLLQHPARKWSGLFLQPRSPHGALTSDNGIKCICLCILLESSCGLVVKRHKIALKPGLYSRIPVAEVLEKSRLFKAFSFNNSRPIQCPSSSQSFYSIQRYQYSRKDTPT